MAHWVELGMMLTSEGSPKDEMMEHKMLSIVPGTRLKCSVNSHLYYLKNFFID